MLVPELAGGDRGVADVLVDELQVPRLADAEAIHGADLHVRHHLRRRNGDGLDVLVGIDAAGGEPVADPEIVRAAREGLGGLHRLAGGLLLFQRLLERLGVEADACRSAYSLATEMHWLSRLSRARMYIGVGTLFCVTLPAEIRYGIGVRMCAPSMPLPSRAEHEIVARRTPRRLLENFGVGHAVLGEEALVLGDEQRAGIGERDEAELGALHLGAGALRERAAGKLRLHRAEQRGGAGGALEEFAAARSTSVRCPSSSLCLSSSLVSGLRSANKKAAACSGPSLASSRSAALLVGPSLDRDAVTDGPVSVSQIIQASCQIGRSVILLRYGRWLTAEIGNR